MDVEVECIELGRHGPNFVRGSELDGQSPLDTVAGIVMAE